VPLHHVRRCQGLLLAAVTLAVVLAPAAALADPTFGVMNASGGIYWRSGPDWNTAEAVAGNGFYPDTTIAVHCYQSGAGNVPGSADTMWEQASVAGGSGTGSGWINEHFVNDGSSINQPSPGVPPCNAPAPPAQPSITASIGGQYGCGNCSALNIAVHNFPTGTYTYYCHDNSGSGGSDAVFYSHQVSVTDPNQSTWPGVFCDDNAPYTAYLVMDGVTSNSVAFPSVTSSTSTPPTPTGPTTPAISQPVSRGGPTPGGSLYYSPYRNGFITLDDGHSQGYYPPPYTTDTLWNDQWYPNKASGACVSPTTSVIPANAPGGIYNNQVVTTVAAWSAARNAPLILVGLRSAAAWQHQVHYLLLIDPGNLADYANSPCNKYALSYFLARWLALSSSNRLAVLAGKYTIDASHPTPSGLHDAGLQEYVFPNVKSYHNAHGQNIRNQVTVCNYGGMLHPETWINFRSWIPRPPITASGCPSVAGYRNVRGWHP
jgi:hypothetical protein